MGTKKTPGLKNRGRSQAAEKTADMAQIIYCWRCRADVPMLEEHEWEVVAPHLSNAIEQIKKYRQEHKCSLAVARAQGYGQEALRVYEQLTGYCETNADALWHHRVNQYGPRCEACGKPYRTPSAVYCVACGAHGRK